MKSHLLLEALLLASLISIGPFSVLIYTLCDFKLIMSDLWHEDDTGLRK